MKLQFVIMICVATLMLSGCVNEKNNNISSSDDFEMAEKQVIEDNILAPMGADPSMTLAFAHIIFNFVTTFVLYFFVNKLVLLANKLIKDTEEEHKIYM